MALPRLAARGSIQWSDGVRNGARGERRGPESRPEKIGTETGGTAARSCVKSILDLGKPDQPRQAFSPAIRDRGIDGLDGPGGKPAWAAPVDS